MSSCGRSSLGRVLQNLRNDASLLRDRVELADGRVSSVERVAVRMRVERVLGPACSEQDPDADGEDLLDRRRCSELLLDELADLVVVRVLDLAVLADALQLLVDEREVLLVAVLRAGDA